MIRIKNQRIMKNTVFIVLLSLGLSLMAEPVDAQERMDDMWGEQKEKYSSKNSVRGQLFEWGKLCHVYTLGTIFSAGKQMEWKNILWHRRMAHGQEHGKYRGRRVQGYCQNVQSGKF